MSPSQIRYFQPADGGEWHAYRDESAQALCGEATLSYNRDRVADTVPTDGSLHDGCRQAIDAENPGAYAPHPDDAVTESTEVAAETSDNETPTGETDGGETPTTPSTETTDDGSPADAQGAGVDPETPATPDGGETDEVASDDVAPVASVLGEPDPAAPAAPPADQPPA